MQLRKQKEGLKEKKRKRKQQKSQKLMIKINRHKIIKVLITHLLEEVIKIEVKDSNVEQALRVLKRKLQRDGFFKVIKLKNTYEKPSEKKKEFCKKILKELKN